MGKAAASGHRPAAVKVDKYIDHCTDDRKVPMDRKFASHKPANPGTGEEKN